MENKYPAFYQTMTESEAGWGTRPDGFLVALTTEAFYARAQKIKEAGSYAEYSRVDGAPIACYVTEDTQNKLLENNGSVWLFLRPSDLSWKVE